jgi:hypothetical protein
MMIKWIGPGGGLGSRILALGSVLAISRIMQSTITFPWRLNSACPAGYHELFEEMPGIVVDNSLTNNDELIGTNDWEPMIIYQNFKERTKHTMPLEEYCVSFVEAIRSLQYKKSILDELALYYNCSEGNPRLAIHIRRTDRIMHHGKSLYGLLSTQSHKVKRSLTVIRNTGIRKTLQYSLLPENLIRSLENKQLAKACIEFLDRDDGSTYSIYADSNYELLSLQQDFRNLGISDARYIPSYCNAPGKSSWGAFGKRQTSMQDALIELLGMSMSAGILQNISASTFSICSSIIGSTPILTSQPKHLFWRSIKKTLGKFPYEVAT